MPDAIVWNQGEARYRGYCVEEREVRVAGMRLRLAAMHDATTLLDEPDYARRFLDEDKAPYGVELWPAAIMLAEYIACEQDGPFEGLEIGCGLGLVSMVAARLGWSMTAGDHEPTALTFARHNAATNGIENIEFIEFDWNNPPAGVQFERVLGADVLYQLNNHGPILRCLDKVLAPGGLALISDPGRGVAYGFSDAARAASFDVELSPTVMVPEGGKPLNGRVFRLRKRLGGSI